MRQRVAEVLRSLERLGTRGTREGFARYGIVAPKAFGCTMGDIQKLGKKLGRDHELALALWPTGWYEARLLCAYVDDPAQVTSAQMDSWVKDFDNWGICDTICFALWDRTPLGWKKIVPWSRRKEEFVKRSAFALIASLAGHDKAAPDEKFLKLLPVIERGASDERNFVKKGVSWALRSMGRRRGVKPAALALAKNLAASDDPTERWIGKDAVKDLSRR